MSCNGCEYYSEVVISYLDSNNINIDLGIRIIQCSKKKQELIENHPNEEYTNNKSKKTSNIGVVKIFDCDNKFKSHTVEHNKELKTPDWCPRLNFNYKK